MTHPSTLQLHQLRYGELSGEALGRVRSHLAGCDACAARLRAQEAERAAFVARPVPAALRQAAAPPRPAWWQWLAPLLVAAAVVLCVRALRDAPASGAAGPEAPEIRFRGELPAVEVWVKGDRGPRALGEDERLGPGSVVQLKYDPRGASAIAIAGRDGSGKVEVYTTEAPIGIGLVTAPFALTLDATPGDQELFVVGSPQPLDEGLVRLAVTRGLPGVRVGKVRLPR